MKRVVLIEGMACNQCKEALQAILYDLPGVTRVEVDLVRGTAAIESDLSVDEDDIRIAVEEVGYELKEFVDIF